MARGRPIAQVTLDEVKQIISTLTYKIREGATETPQIDAFRAVQALKKTARTQKLAANDLVAIL
jgi:hypothetical protein